MSESLAAPAWLTDDIADEWISQDEDQRTPSDRSHPISDISLARSTRVSFEESARHSDSSNQSDPGQQPAGGTVCIREDVPPSKAPVKVNFNAKSIFSPLALERMFDPPSPPNPPPESLSSLPPRPSAPLPTTPVVPSRLSEVYLPPEDDSDENGGSMNRSGLEEEESTPEPEVEPRPELNALQRAGFQFTFAVPGHSPMFPTTTRPNALSTPGRPPNEHPNAPHTDPRLRLFQLNYDTFTRDHLSAMVDSIQINTPSNDSASGFSKYSPPSVQSTYAQTSTCTADGSMSRLRSAKRLKLSPPNELTEEGEGTAIVLRHRMVKDYVGESKSLMEKIKQAQDFSTISTFGTGESAATGALQVQPSSERSENSGENIIYIESDLCSCGHCRLIVSRRTRRTHEQGDYLDSRILPEARILFSC